MEPRNPHVPGVETAVERPGPARCAYCGCEIHGVPVMRGDQLFDSEEHAAHAEQGE